MQGTHFSAGLNLLSRTEDYVREASVKNMRRERRNSEKGYDEDEEEGTRKLEKATATTKLTQRDKRCISEMRRKEQ
jgi:hypothetical protein